MATTPSLLTAHVHIQASAQLLTDIKVQWATHYTLGYVGTCGRLERGKLASAKADIGTSRPLDGANYCYPSCWLGP